MIDGFGTPEAESELVRGHGTTETSRSESDYSYGGAGVLLPNTAGGVPGRSLPTRAPTPPQTPLEVIISRLERANERLVAANERLAGCSGRLGTCDPSPDERTADARSSGPGFIDAANNRLADLFQTIDATAALAEAFSGAI